MTRVHRQRGPRWLAAAGLLLTSAFLTVMLGGQPAHASADSFTTSTVVPISIGVFVPCANGGAGEVVDLSGSLHLLFHVTVDDAGGVHVKSHTNPQGVSGVGEITGDKYQGTGVTQDSVHVGSGGLPFTFTFVNNFRIIGQGPDNNLRVHENFHVTINANGTVTAFVDNFSVTCG